MASMMTTTQTPTFNFGNDQAASQSSFGNYKMASMVATTQASTFNFGKFPYEIRQKIWNLLLPSPADQDFQEFVNAMARHITMFMHLNQTDLSRPQQHPTQTRYGQSTVYALHSRTVSPYTDLAGCAESRIVALRQLFKMLRGNAELIKVMDAPRMRGRWVQQCFDRKLKVDCALGGLVYSDMFLPTEVRLEELVFWDYNAKLREKEEARRLRNEVEKLLEAAEHSTPADRHIMEPGSPATSNATAYDNDSAFSPSLAGFDNGHGLLTWDDDDDMRSLHSDVLEEFVSIDALQPYIPNLPKPAIKKRKRNALPQLPPASPVHCPFAGYNTARSNLNERFWDESANNRGFRRVKRRRLNQI